MYEWAAILDHTGLGLEQGLNRLGKNRPRLTKAWQSREPGRNWMTKEPLDEVSIHGLGKNRWLWASPSKSVYKKSPCSRFQRCTNEATGIDKYDGLESTEE